MASKTAKSIMTDSPAVCTPDTTAQDAARMMEENDCGSLPVVEGRDSMKLVGMVTDRDLAIRVLGRGQAPSTPVREAMSKNISSIKVDVDLNDVERVMSGQQVRRISPASSAAPRRLAGWWRRSPSRRGSLRGAPAGPPAPLSL